MRDPFGAKPGRHQSHRQRPRIASSIPRLAARPLVEHGVDVDATLSRGPRPLREDARGDEATARREGSQRGFLPRGAEAGALGLREAKEGFAFGATGNRWPWRTSARAVLETAHANLTRAARRVVALAVAAGATRPATAARATRRRKALAAVRVRSLRWRLHGLQSARRLGTAHVSRRRRRRGRLPRIRRRR